MSNPKSLNTVIKDDELILDLYKTVISTNSKSFVNATKKAIEDIEQSVGIKIDFVDISRLVKQHSDNNYIVIARKGNQKFWPLIQRIRNATCHHNIRLNPDSTYTLMDNDYYDKTKKNKLVMWGNIDESKFKTLINELKKHLKQ